MRSAATQRARFARASHARVQQRAAPAFFWRAARALSRQPPDAAVALARLCAQFKNDFGDKPKREDLTIIAPRVDDPEDLVRPSRGALRRQTLHP